MPKSLTVGTQTFEIPLQGDSPDYGEQLSDFFEAVADALESVQAPGDILVTTSAILNNQSSFTNISGFSFSTATVRKFNAEFIIERSTISPAQKFVESGFLNGNYDGSIWTFTVTGEGDAGIDWNMTSGGQFQYKSSNITGSSYSGTIKFRARVINA